MLRTSRFLVVALPAVILVAAYWLRPVTPSVTNPRPVTVEPTLPLRLELQALPADPRRGAPERLEVTVDASGEIQDLSLSLMFPDGAGGDDSALSVGEPFRLHSGDKRDFLVPLWARHSGAFPIRLKASFRLQDGRTLQTEQGVVWHSGPGRPEGRYHAGAYEWMGVAVGEPQP